MLHAYLVTLQKGDDEKVERVELMSDRLVDLLSVIHHLFPGWFYFEALEVAA